MPRRWRHGVCPPKRKRRGAHRFFHVGRFALDTDGTAGCGAGWWQLSVARSPASPLFVPISFCYKFDVDLWCFQCALQNISFGSWNELRNGIIKTMWLLGRLTCKLAELFAIKVSAEQSSSDDVCGMGRPQKISNCCISGCLFYLKWIPSAAVALCVYTYMYGCTLSKSFTILARRRLCTVFISKGKFLFTSVLVSTCSQAWHITSLLSLSHEALHWSV